MKKQLKFPIILLVVVLMAVSGGFSQNPPKEASQKTIYGVTIDGVYKNDFFGLEFEVPKGWLTVDSEESRAAMKIGTDVFKSDDARANQALEFALERELTILHVSKKPMGSIGNINLILNAMRQPSRAVTPRMVAEATKSALIASPVVKVTKDTRMETLGGKPVAVIDFQVTVSGQTINTRFFAAMVDTYAVTIGYSYSDDADLAELDKLVRTIKFTKK